MRARALFSLDRLAEAGWLAGTHSRRAAAPVSIVPQSVIETTLSICI